MTPNISRTPPSLSPIAPSPSVSSDPANSSVMPTELQFAVAARNEHKRAHIQFGKFTGTPKAEAEIAHALNSSHRKGLTIKEAGTSKHPYQVISFETYSAEADRRRPEDVLVVLHASLAGQAQRCELKNPRTSFPKSAGKFRQSGDEPRNVPYSPASVDIAALRQQWRNQQETEREAFTQANLIKKDVTENDGLQFPDVDYFNDFKRPTGTSNMDRHEILQEAEWVHGDSFLTDLFAGTTKLGDNLDCKNLKWLGIPQHLEELGNNFNAPNLSRLDFFQKQSFEDAPTGQRREPKTIGGEIHRIGDHFHAPNLQQLDLSYQENFRHFGHHFHAPNLVGLSLKKANNFEEFPADIHIPALVTLDLTGATNFHEFPPHFFDNVPQLRSLELRGTAVRYRDLPQHIRDNLDIYIDIRPVDEANVRLGGQQTTHQQSVHFSSTESAKRIVSKAANVDLEKELERLKGYIDALPPTPIPEGLESHLQSNLADQVQYVHTLDRQHPHRQYFASPIEAAKRALSGKAAYYHFVDPGSQISTMDYLAACWHAIKNPDNLHEQVTDETAREKFVQTLYEIQRGYNLKGEDDNLEDDGDPRDLTICGPGAFNKITNTMSEILKDAETIYITDDSIKLKTASCIKHKVQEMLENTTLSLSDLTEPDEDGAIFCTDEVAQQIRNDLLKELSDLFRMGNGQDNTHQKRVEKIAGFLDYQLTTTNLQSIVTSAKGKAVAL